MSIEESSTFEYGEEDFIHHTAPWADKDAPQLSKFDKELQQRWDQAMADGAFRYDISNLQTRILPGPSGYVAQLNTLRGIERRAPQKISSVRQPFNPKEFNFNKVKPIEVIFNLSNKSWKQTRNIPKIDSRLICKDSNNVSSENSTVRNGFVNNLSNNSVVNGNDSKCDNGLECDRNGFNDSDRKSDYSSSNGDHSTTDKGKVEDCNGSRCEEDKDRSHMLVINVSPMEYGHCLLVPNRKLCLPQVMTEESFEIAIETMLLSRHRGLRMGFNSLCAFASVNHLHFHMFYLDYELISDYCHVRHLAGMYYEYTALPCPGFALQLYGTTAEQLSRQAYRISNYLYENDIAHNMFLCRGVVFGEERNSTLTTIRLFIWPRRKFIGHLGITFLQPSSMPLPNSSSTFAFVNYEKCDESILQATEWNKSSEEFNVACIELVGHLPVKIEDGFHKMTEPDVNAILADACLPQSEYEDIRAKVVEMGKENCPKVDS